MSKWIGLDVSKDTIDVGWFVDKKGTHFQIENSKKGFKKLLKNLPDDAKVVMEATGVYHLKCARFLVENEIYVSVENPLCINRYSQMNLRRSKTDRKDAFLIASYGEVTKPDQWVLPSENQLKSQQLLTAIDLQVKMINQIKNQIHAFSNSGIQDMSIIKMLKKTICEIEKIKDKLEADVRKIVEVDYKREFNLLYSIPGIGISTVCLFLAKVGDCSTFETSRQLACFFGLTPSERFSGTSIRKKGGISRMGSSRMRRQLYMCSLTAIRYNPMVKEMKKRMEEKGKHNKKILVAGMNKLVRQMFGVLKSGQRFNPGLL